MEILTVSRSGVGLVSVQQRSVLREAFPLRALSSAAGSWVWGRGAPGGARAALCESSSHLRRMTNSHRTPPPKSTSTPRLPSILRLPRLNTTAAPAELRVPAVQLSPPSTDPPQSSPPTPHRRGAPESTELRRPPQSRAKNSSSDAVLIHLFISLYIIYSL